MLSCNEDCRTPRGHSNPPGRENIDVEVGSSPSIALSTLKGKSRDQVSGAIVSLEIVPRDLFGGLRLQRAAARKARPSLPPYRRPRSTEPLGVTCYVSGDSQVAGGLSCWNEPTTPRCAIRPTRLQHALRRAKGADAFARERKLRRHLVRAR